MRPLDRPPLTFPLPSRPLTALVAAYLALGTLFATTVPLWEAPDAIWHYHFVAHLAAGNGLPVRADEGVDAPWRQQGSQPPLYYLLAAPLVVLVDTSDAAQVIRFNPHAAVGVAGPGGNVNRMVHTSREAFPWRGIVLAARLVSLLGVVFGLVAVLATWMLARTVFPDRPAVAIAATGLLAFNPQFLFLSGSIGNDVAIAAAGALVLWRAAVVLREGATPGRCGWLGVACGLALLSKLSGVWLLPVAGLAVGWAVWHGAGRSPDSSESRDQRVPSARRILRLARDLVRPGLWLAVPLLLVAGWWYARNLVLFGDPTGLPLMLSVMRPRELPPTWRELLVQMAAVWRSYWAVFGWFNVPAPDWVYWLFDALAVIGLGRLTVLVARRRLDRREVEGGALALGTVGLIVIALVAWAQVRYPQGRLAFPAAPALSLLIGAGWVVGTARGATVGTASRTLAIALGGGQSLVAVGLLAAVILPAYRPPAASPVPSTDSAVVFEDPETPGSGIALVEASGDAVPATARPGDVLDLKLRWTTIASNRPVADYSIFLHLVDDDALDGDADGGNIGDGNNGVIVAQRDTYPASGNAPTSDWRPGMVYLDRHRFQIPATTAAPCDCRLRLGVYDQASGTRLRSDAHGETLDLGPVRVEPAVGPDGVPNPLGVPFGDDIVLAGFALDRRAARAGETFDLTLYWKARRAPPADYKVSVQLRRGAAEIWAQRDEQPADGNRPTPGWRAGEIVEDRHPVLIYPEAPADDYTLFVKLYDRETGQPLPVNVRDFELVLGGFRVLPNRPIPTPETSLVPIGRPPAP